MTREDLQNFIRNNCFTKSGREGFNNRVSKESWWVNKNHTEVLDRIKEETSFYDGDDSIVIRCWFIHHDIFMSPKCVVCGNNTNFDTFKEGFFRTCSNKCATSDPIRNNKIKEKLDYVAIQEKLRQTNLEKYGVEYWFQTKESTKQIKQTKLEKYGDKNYNNPDKNKQTNLEKYGNEYWFTSNEGKKKLQESKLQNGGGSFVLPREINEKLNDSDLLVSMNETMSMTEIADVLKVTPRTIKLKFDKFGLTPKFHPNRSCLLQGKLLDDIKEFYDSTIIFNDNKTISPKELDFFFPEKNLAIELNGVYWHSEDGTTESKKYTHSNKLALCQEKGIDLIQITDIEYSEKKDLVISLIQNRLGVNRKIPARKCKVSVLSKETLKDFLNTYHLQGNIASSISYGLYHDNELVSVMTFGKTRFSKKKTYEYELLRFCNKIGISVIGSANKLFKHFIKEHNPSEVISYCDLSKFTGNVYEKMGFDLSHTSNPNYFYYTRNENPISRYQAQKHKLCHLLVNFDPEKSESENMFSNGYRRYWDCGMNVYIWKSPR
jgi:hypothetical protein